MCALKSVVLRAGVYALLSAASSLGTKQRAALLQLLRALCSIQRKQWTAADLDQAHGDLLLAVCMVEAYLPVTEMDIKLHALLHLPDKIRSTGPLWTTSMFVYEGMWSVLLRLASNQRSPELSLLRGFADHELAFMAYWEDPERFAVRAVRSFEEDFVQKTSERYQVPRPVPDQQAEVVLTGAFTNIAATDPQLLALHTMYLYYDDE